MIYVYNGNQLTINWTIFKGQSPCKEDFSRAMLRVFLVCSNYDLNPRFDDEYVVSPDYVSTSEGTITVTIPQSVMSTYPVGLYSLKAVWVKNKQLLHDHSDIAIADRNLSVVQNKFAITDVMSEATNPESTDPTLNVKSAVATYGYDGIDAYELAVLIGKTLLKRSEWVNNVAEMNESYEAIEKEWDNPNPAQGETQGKKQDIEDEIESVENRWGDVKDEVDDKVDEWTAAENERKSNELTRQSSEATRNGNESTRQYNESARQTNESARQSYESTRQSNESARELAEDVRKSAEESRVEYENEREENENGRISNENERIESETARENAENTRDSAETARESAESTRQSNESTRQSNETARESAESTRQATFTTNEATRQSTFDTNEGSSTDTPSSTGSRWARYNNEEERRQEAMQIIEDSAVTFTNLSNSIADAWAASTDYVVGDVVMNAGIRYKCTTAHTSGSSFDSSKWTTESVQDDTKIVSGYYYKNQFYAESTHVTTLVPESGKLYIDLTNGKNAAYIYNGGEYQLTSIINPVEIGHIRNLEVTENSVTIKAGEYIYIFDEHDGKRNYITIDEDTTFTLSTEEVLVFDKVSSQILKQIKTSTTRNQVILLSFDVSGKFSTNGLWGAYVKDALLSKEIKGSVKDLDEKMIKLFDDVNQSLYVKNIVSSSSRNILLTTVRDWGKRIRVKVLSSELETTNNKIDYAYVYDGEVYYSSFDIADGCVINSESDITSLRIYISTSREVITEGTIELAVYYGESEGIYDDVSNIKAKLPAVVDSVVDFVKTEEQAISSAVSKIEWGKKTIAYGEIVDDERFLISPIIPCKYLDTIEVDSGTTVGTYINCYKENGEYIDSYGLNMRPRTFTISSAKMQPLAYIRYSVLKSAYNNMDSYVKVNGVLKFKWTKNLYDIFSSLQEVILLRDKTDDLIATDENISNISAKIANAVDGDNLIFLHITDIHAGSTSMTKDISALHMNMACKLANNFNADFIALTGDAIHGYDENALPAKDSWNALLSKIGIYSMPIIFAEGNYVHDFGYQGELNRQQVQTFGGRLGKWVNVNAIYNENDTVKSYYYFDNIKSNVRVFILDAQDFGNGRLTYGFSNEQVTFVSNALSDANSKNMPVLFFAHMPPVAELMSKDWGMGVNGAAMVNAISAFTANGGRVLAYIYGHEHWDNYYFDPTNKIPYISCQQDWISGGGTVPAQPQWGYATRTAKGSGINQYSMDAYSLNVNTGKCHIFRFGAGHDRIINVISNSVSVGNNITINTELTGTITWFINDSNIASINDGVITGLVQGNTWATATDSNGNTEYYIIQVI